MNPTPKRSILNGSINGEGLFCGPSKKFSCGKYFSNKILTEKRFKVFSTAYAFFRLVLKPMDNKLVVTKAKNNTIEAINKNFFILIVSTCYRKVWITR